MVHQHARVCIKNPSEEFLEKFLHRFLRRRAFFNVKESQRSKWLIDEPGPKSNSVEQRMQPTLVNRREVHTLFPVTVSYHYGASHYAASYSVRIWLDN